MDTAKINELKTARAAHVVRMREILNTADADSRDLTGEERSEYDRLEVEVDAKGERIKLEEKQSEREAHLEEIDDRGFDPRHGQGGDDAPGEARDKAYADTFRKYLRHGAAELDGEERKLLQAGFRSDQIKGTTTLGGFTVPTSFSKQLVQHQVQAGAMRQTRATHLQTDSGEDIQIPKTTAHGTANWIGEGNAITPDTETFGQVTLKSYVAAEIVRVSVQLLADTGVDLEGYLSKALGQNIGRLENTGFVAGVGTTQPTGLSTLTSLGVTAASATAIAADEILDLFYSVAPPYRVDAEWMMADLTIKAVRKLKLSTGEYIWAPGLTVNESDTLLGKKVWDDPDVPAMTTGKKSILFGDLSAYWIRDAGSFVLRRLDERYADNLLVGFLAYHRTDGNLIDQSGAVKHLIQA